MVDKFDYPTEGRILTDKEHVKQVLQRHFDVQTGVNNNVVEQLGQISSDSHPNFFLGSDLSEVQTDYDELLTSISAVGAEQNRELQQFSEEILVSLADTDKDPLRQIYDLYDAASQEGMDISFEEFREAAQAEFNRDIEESLTNLFELVQEREPFGSVYTDSDGKSASS